MQIKVSNEILNKVSKPARYTGGELNAVQKDFDSAACKFLLSLPDVYEVGMSNLGLSILYGILNKREDTLCERVYSPWIDMEEEMRRQNIPLFSLETKHAAKDFDIWGFSLQYEMIFTNVLNMLDLAGIAIHSAERDEEDPFIIGGGPCVYNVEPMADFFDFFVVGEGEEIIGEIAEEFVAWKNEGKPGGRKNFLKRLLKIPGIYVPSFYEPIYSGEDFAGLKKLEPAAPSKIYKRVVKDFDAVPSVQIPIVPFIDVVHNRVMLELFRGCTRGCRFCQAGTTYRPVRERSPETLRKMARTLIDLTGHDEISLTSLSSADYSQLENLVDDLMFDFCNERVNFSLPSLRIDSFSVNLADKVQAVRKSGLTFAPEAGTQRLRDVINKGVTEENLLNACAAAFQKGWKSVKLYFMCGLPTETDEDIAGIADLAKKVVDLYTEIKGKRGVKVTVSVSCFVPKPFTPFQRFGQISLEEFERKQKLLKSLIRDKSIVYNYHNAKLSVLEGAIARGDRRISKVIETAWKNGAKFDGWSDLFKYEIWRAAFESCGIDDKYFSERERAFYEPLAWDHTSPGINESFLQSEWEKAQSGELTRDCRKTSCTGCGVCMNLGVAVKNFAKTEFQKTLPAEKKNLPQNSERFKYRAQIQKGAEISVLSHLEYMNVFMRALLRSKLPAAYSEGFNPHLKVSFATALAVGVTSDAEFVDFELTEDIKTSEIFERLNFCLPAGSKILRIKKLHGKTAALMTLADLARWEVRVPFSGSFEDALNSAEKFNSAKEFLFTRITPKRTREIEIKSFVTEPVKIFENGEKLLIKFGTKITPEGSLKPSEVLKVLEENFDLKIKIADSEIHCSEMLGKGKNIFGLSTAGD